MTVEAGSHDPVSCLLGPEMAKWMEDSWISLSAVFLPNQQPVGFELQRSWMREGSIVAITFSVKKPTWPGGCGLEAGKPGTCLQQLPGMPSGVSPSSREQTSIPSGGR